MQAHIAGLDAERRRLQAANERLELALEASGVVGLWDWMIDTDLLHGDANFARLYGLDPAGTAAGLTMEAYQAFVVVEDLAGLRAEIRNTFDRGADFLVEYRVAIPRQPLRWVECKGKLIHDAGGKPVRFSGTAVDITARKRADDEIRAHAAVADANAERVQLAMQAGAIIGTWVWDVEHDRFTIDEGFGKAFGLDPVLGHQGIRLEQVVDTVHPDDKAGLAAAIKKAIDACGPYVHQYRVRHRDGVYYWVEANGRVERGGHGLAQRFPGVLIDVTERRRIETERDRVAAELQDLNGTLEQRVVERTATLVETQEALRQSQKMEAIGQLTGGVAHDFNNVLAVIKSSVELLRRVPLNDERRARFMDTIANAVTRGARLTGQLLAFARRQALQSAVFDVGQSTHAVAEMIGSLTGAGVEVVLELPQQACFANTDQSQFDTALVNLAVNARDAMLSKGTLSIKVSAVDGIPPSRYQPGTGGDFVAVSLHDTGTGIAPDNLDKIFEPFFTTKGVGHGTGLGLSQVFGFARQSGGDIRVESVVGEGSTFTLYLARVAQPAQQIVPIDATGTLPAGGGLDILAVEDNAELSSMVESTLQELGYATTVAPTAERALELLRAYPGRFAAVFSDVVLPGMNGIDLARTIAELKIDMPVVLTSGYSHVLTQDMEHGFILLPKPYALEDLAHALHSAVSCKDKAHHLAQVLPGQTLESLGRGFFAQPDTQRTEQVEQARLGELAALRIMDSEDEAVYDELTGLAALLCQTPIALISLVDDKRQWFKSRIGLQATETPREHAFCAHTIEQPEQTMQVIDARLDERFANNPLVTGDPGIRFYAGAPLVTSTGQALGALCVIDTAPRKLTPAQLDALEILATKVVERLETRRPA